MILVSVGFSELFSLLIFDNFFSIPLQFLRTYSSFLLLSILLCGQPGQQNLQFCKFSFFVWLIIVMSGLLAEIKRSVYMLKLQRSLCVSFSRTDFGLCIYIFSCKLPVDHPNNQSCLVLYSFCTNLQHSLIL